MLGLQSVARVHLGVVGGIPLKFMVPPLHLSTTSSCQIKQIALTNKEDSKTLIIEGVHVTSPREKYLLQVPPTPTQTTNCDNRQQQDHSCSLCKLGLPVKHTDVLILRQFVDPFGRMMQRKVTGLCKTQQRRVSYLVQMAHLAGILKTPYTKEPTRRFGFMKYNKYYDESVIDEFIFGRRKRA